MCSYMWLVMPLSEVLSRQLACHVCHTKFLPLYLQRVVYLPIHGMGIARIELRVDHLQWSRTLAWNN